MTEDEAKTKWCPFYRVATSGGAGDSTYEMDNRPRDGIPPPEGAAKDAPWTPGQTINPWACCIGSACMAWRATDNEGGPWSPTEEKEPVSKPAGYCGLAGKP